MTKRNGHNLQSQPTSRRGNSRHWHLVRVPNFQQLDLGSQTLLILGERRGIDTAALWKKSWVILRFLGVLLWHSAKAQMNLNALTVSVLM